MMYFSISQFGEIYISSEKSFITWTTAAALVGQSWTKDQNKRHLSLVEDEDEAKASSSDDDYDNDNDNDCHKQI